MDDSIETFTVDGLTVKIYQDTDAESPLDWDCEPTLVTFGGIVRSGFGESSPYDDVAEWAAYSAFDDSGTRVADAIPCRLDNYGSGGMQIVESDWDSDRANAVVYVTPERQKEWGTDYAHLRGNLTGFLETLNQYFEGDIYGYIVRDEQGEPLDSCWGFYGVDYAVKEARSVAEGLAASRLAAAGRLYDALVAGGRA